MKRAESTGTATITNMARRRLLALVSNNEVRLFLALVLIGMGFSFASEFFLTTRNLLNITRQVSVNFVVAVGMTFLLLVGEIDLSVGSTAAFAGVVTAATLVGTGSGFLSIVAGIVAGSLVGFLNGAITIWGRVQSFVVTLAMMGIARGIAFVWTGGHPISGLPASFGLLGSGFLGEVPVPSVVAGGIFVTAYIILSKTKHGLFIRAIGSNPEAARLSAISLTGYKLFVFVACGALSALGGIMLTSRLLSAQPVAATGLELDVIASAILGGASLTGGIGTIQGTALGALIIGVINNGLNLLGVSAFYQQIVKGLIILMAVTLKRGR